MDFVPESLSPKGEKTYRRIVDATVRVIATEGVRAVTHRRVARAAESSVGLVTYYFSTTEALIAATLEEVAALETSAHDRVRERVVELGDDVAGIVEVLAQEVADRSGPRRTVALASIALTLELTDRRDDRAPFDAWEGAQRALCDAVIQALDREPDQPTSMFLAAAMEGLYFFAVIAPDPSVIEEAARAGLSQVLRSLRPAADRVLEALS